MYKLWNTVYSMNEAFYLYNQQTFCNIYVKQEQTLTFKQRNYVSLSSVFKNSFEL